MRTMSTPIMDDRTQASQQCCLDPFDLVNKQGQVNGSVNDLQVSQKGQKGQHHVT